MHVHIICKIYIFIVERYGVTICRLSTSSGTWVAEYRFKISNRMWPHLICLQGAAPQLARIKNLLYRAHRPTSIVALEPELSTRWQPEIKLSHKPSEQKYEWHLCTQLEYGSWSPHQGTSTLVVRCGVTTQLYSGFLLIVATVWKNKGSKSQTARGPSVCLQGAAPQLALRTFNMEHISLQGIVALEPELSTRWQLEIILSRNPSEQKYERHLFTQPKYGSWSQHQGTSTLVVRCGVSTQQYAGFPLIVTTGWQNKGSKSQTSHGCI